MSTSIVDACYTLGLLGRAAIDLVVDDVATRLSGFPNRAQELGPGFVDATLRVLHPGARIAGIEVLGAHSGTTSRARIAVEGKGTLADGRPLPRTLFLKLTPTGTPQRILVDATGIGRSELGFYRHVRPGLPVRAPECLGIATARRDRRFVMLLEDLAASGVQLATVTDRVRVEQAEAVMDALATLHAHFWESPRFARDLAFVPRFESREGRSLRWERVVTAQMVSLCERSFRDDLGPALARTAALCRNERDALEDQWRKGPRTLIHGDCHVGNLFFEDGRAGFLDWQVCSYAPGMRDVSYFLCNSFSGELRGRHEKALIARYLEGLETAGVRAPSEGEAFDQHRLFALYTFIAAAFTAAAGESLQPREITLAALRRAVRASEELDSVAYCRAIA